MLWMVIELEFATKQDIKDVDAAVTHTSNAIKKFDLIYKKFGYRDATITSAYQNLVDANRRLKAVAQLLYYENVGFTSHKR